MSVVAKTEYNPLAAFDKPTTSAPSLCNDVEVRAATGPFDGDGESISSNLQRSVDLAPKELLHERVRTAARLFRSALEDELALQQHADVVSDCE